MIHQEYFLTDGISRPIRVLLLGTDGYNELPDDDREPIVLGMGYGENIRVLEPLATELVGRAERARVPFPRQVVVYDPPETHNFENRFTVFAAVDDLATHNGDLAARLSGHSLGGLLSIHEAIRKLGLDQRVSALAPISPHAIAPVHCQTTQEFLEATAKSTLELLELPFHLGNPTVRHLGASILWHTVPHPIEASMEGIDIVGCAAAAGAATNVNVALRRTDPDGLSRMRLVTGDMDGICPSGPMERSLRIAQFPMEDFIVRRGMKHGDPITNKRWVNDIEAAIMLTLEQNHDELQQVATPKQMPGLLERIHCARRHLAAAS